MTVATIQPTAATASIKTPEHRDAANSADGHGDSFGAALASRRAGDGNKAAAAADRAASGKDRVADAASHDAGKAKDAKKTKDGKEQAPAIQAVTVAAVSTAAMPADGRTVDASRDAEAVSAAPTRPQARTFQRNPLHSAATAAAGTARLIAQAAREAKTHVKDTTLPAATARVRGHSATRQMLPAAAGKPHAAAVTVARRQVVAGNGEANAAVSAGLAQAADATMARTAAGRGEQPLQSAHQTTLVMPLLTDARSPTASTALHGLTHNPQTFAAVHAATTPGTPGAAAFTAQLQAPLGSDGWNQALQQQSLRLTRSGGGRADLTLYPRELGQIQVTLTMGEQTHLHLASPNAHVRSAAEAALPQLRLAFAQNGISLGDASVSDQGHQPFDSERQYNPSHGSHGGRTDTAESAPAQTPLLITRIAGRTATGGIDIFA